MTEKYASGALHPGEVFEQFNKLDVFDQDSFLMMLLSDDDIRERIGKLRREMFQ